ncbi:MAG: CPBP family intramembrane metalloprotease [Brevinematales bacterium]|nr:CPBP family intramembrane metalloprotease [Brevinematales bacterium]
MPDRSRITGIFKPFICVLLAIFSLIPLNWIIPGYNPLSPQYLGITLVFFTLQIALFILILRFVREFVPAAVYFLILSAGVFIPPQYKFFVAVNFYSIVPYLILILIVPSLRPGRDWIRAGKIDKVTALLLVLTVVVASGALVLWTYLAKPDMTGFLSLVPLYSPLKVIGIMLAFSVFNAIGEEFMFRGILQEGLNSVISSRPAVIAIQALLFGVWHFNGFPGGVSGMALVWVWGLMLGWIRERSGGMLAPLLAHFFADLTIFLLIVLTRGVFA